ncbi:HD domain protein [uncultured archaeon]|nr:HD domain protein [uncultured archaeon]
MDDTDFVFQLGNLKRTPRSGWLSIGIKGCESVAEHSFRTAILAYIIAKKEGFDEECCKSAALLGLMHDAHESRVGDLHKLAKQYARMDEKKAMRDSAGPLAGYAHATNPKIAQVVKDADLLEMFFQAKEYMDEGNRYAKEWLAPQKLKTKSARKLYAEMKARDSRAWLLGAVEW